MAKAKAKKGRPSKYKKEYCDLLIKHMAKGLSFESFAGVVKVAKDTLYQWEAKHEEFSDSKKTATMQSLLFWESLGIRGAAGKLPNFNSGTWIFNMKNRFGWRDKQDVETNTKIEINIDSEDAKL